jgi:hypothetical protein
LPFLRFCRDKRGYEVTYLMHSFRHRGQPRPRILYCFRTPPNVRVGRAALDEAAIRAIEEHNRDVKFDWTRILQPQSATSCETLFASEKGPGRKERTRPPEARRRMAPLAAVAPPATEAEPAEAAAERAEAVVEPDKAMTEPTSERRAEALGHGFSQPDGTVSDAAAWGLEAEDEAELMATGQLGEDEADADGEAPWPSGGRDRSWDTTPALPFGAGDDRPLARILRPEDIGRLRARFAEVLARITERVQDSARLGDLRARAERLNPDTWVTTDEVRQGLEEYETVYHSLRAVIGHRRPGRRGAGRRRGRPATERPGDRPKP